MPKSVFLRRAMPDDLDALIAADLAVDAEDSVDEVIEAEGWTSVDHAAHRQKISAFLCDVDKPGWVCVDIGSGQIVGMLLTRFRARKSETQAEADDFLFRYLDESVLPADGRFVEVFQLWVHPNYRRRGLATQMKQACEELAREQRIAMIYTHTRERNAHVIDLNRKLGYVEVRRGVMSDDHVRVSLVKRIA
jgi:ribosomal protein S18 acetylase RimI-like enzyme